MSRRRTLVADDLRTHRTVARRSFVGLLTVVGAARFALATESRGRAQASDDAPDAPRNDPAFLLRGKPHLDLGRTSDVSSGNPRAAPTCADWDIELEQGSTHDRPTPIEACRAASDVDAGRNADRPGRGRTPR